MTKDEFLAQIFESQMFKKWHWFRWHFEHHLRGGYHPLADSIVDACLECENYLPNFSIEMINRISSLSGKEKFLPHWEQLLQQLSEIHVVKQALTYNWGDKNTEFLWEPTAGNSKKNPEIAVKTKDFSIGIEVKAPSIFEHMKNRSSKEIQVPSRVIPKGSVEKMFGVGSITFPRDNPIKDFLLSAESKFKNFKASLPNFYGLLVIVWDDFIYEPISALLNTGSGIFTEHSFAKDGKGKNLEFPSVDGVIILRHLHQFIRVCRDEPLMDNCRHPFDYGRPDEFPFKVYVSNPSNPEIPEKVLDCFQAYPPKPEMGAEYMPTDIIYWT